MPQLAGSLVTSSQALPPQFIVGAGQAHVPPVTPTLQFAPLMQLAHFAPPLPQVPGFWFVVPVSQRLPAQQPFGQEAAVHVQTPDEQTCPDTHCPCGLWQIPQ